MIAISRPLRLTLYTLLIVAGAVLAAGLAMRHAERQTLVDDAARANQQLGLYGNSLHTLIERYRALPAVLALDSEMISALKGPLDAATQGLLNRKLERINGAAQSSTLELMDRPGRSRQQLESAQQLCRAQLRVSPLFQPDPEPGHRPFLCSWGDHRHSRLLPLQRCPG